MYISVNLIVILISVNIVKTSLLDPVIENVVHRQVSHPPSGEPGIWKKKTIWKPRWVKEWKSAKVTKPVWKKVWSPVQIKEWVPIPKPPPGWDSASTPLKPVIQPVKEAPKINTQPTIIKEIHPNVPLWDPVPYPESQQPPPPAAPYYPPCRDDGCGEPSTFNQQQISGIIGAHKYYHQDSAQEYSETVNHLTRIPPGGNYWRQPQQPNPGFNSPDLPGFLVPPRYQQNFHIGNQNQQPRFQNYNFNNNQNNNNNYHPINNHNFNTQNSVQVSHSPGFELQQSQNNGPLPWTPLHTHNNNHNHNNNNNNNQIYTNTNNIKGHFITKAPDHPYKFEIPHQPNQQFNTNTNSQEAVPDANPSTKAGSQTNSPNPRPQVEADDIQQAELVGEYHYSDFDLTKSVQLVPQTPQPIPPPTTTPLPPRKQIPQQHPPRPQKPHQNQPKTPKPQRPQNQPPQPPHQNPQTSSQKPAPKPKAQASHQNPQSPPQKPAPKQEVNKHQQLTVESRPRQVRTENRNPPPQNFLNTRPQNPNTTPNPNFEVEKAITKDIFPIFKPLPNFDIFPSNHRFAPLPDNNILDTNTTLPKTKAHITFHYLPSEEPAKPDVSKEVKKVNENYNATTTTTTTTTETTTPFTVYSSSSFQTSTEAQTTGPVFIVTPSYTAKSLP